MAKKHNGKVGFQRGINAGNLICCKGKSTVVRRHTQKKTL